MAIIELEVRQFFPMIQDGPDTNPVGLLASNFLSLTESIRVNQLFERLKNTINYNQYVTLRRSISNLTLNQFLMLNHQGGQGESITITDFFFMWQSARTVLYEPISQVLNLNQSLNYFRGYGPIHKLTINQIIVLNVFKNKIVTQSYVLISRGNAYKEDPNFIAESSPTLGGPNGTPSYVF